MGNGKLNPSDLAAPCNNFIDQSGFTKRELIAKDVLCAAIASGRWSAMSDQGMAKAAIQITDVFIETFNNS